ncbi:hypothetical protein C7M84_021808 [Penaeus vannamei]|uniref:CCHC-type domain-containing protein n=1 Tax=Penaeus vannamei TaxID=6689 RepID=A0A423S925_PENVA|nr:hypothetical protein C7M84_021808 [Penaeus vannamei]
MANMADDKTEGTQEMAKEQIVLSTGEAAGTPSPVAKGVDLDTAAQATEERAQQAAQQLQATSELKYTEGRAGYDGNTGHETPAGSSDKGCGAYRQMMASLGGTSAVLTSVQGQVLVEGNAAPWALREQDPPEVAPPPWSQQHVPLEEGPSAPRLFPSPPPSTKCIPKDQLGITGVARAAMIDKRLAEYDGKVSWNAFQAQFETVARRQGWNDEEKAYQLVISLKGAAVEVLEHLTAAQMRSYACVVRALQRRFGRRQQPEVYHAQLKTRTRRQDESLPQLAQDIEVLDCFVDALNDKQLQVHVKQAGPHNIQQALVRAAEFEAFLLTATPSYYRGEMTRGLHHIHVRRTLAERSPPSRTNPDGFQVICWRCGLKGHRRNECTSGGANNSRSTKDHRRPIFHPCCRACGDQDHSTKECQELGQGNMVQLEKGRLPSKTPCRPSTRKISAGGSAHSHESGWQD